MGKPWFRIDQSKPEHFDRKEGGLFQGVIGVENGERLLKADSPRGELVCTLVNISAKLQESPENIAENFVLRRQCLVIVRILIGW